MKKELKKVLNPRNLGIHFKKVLKIRRGVVLEVGNKLEVNKFIEDQTVREKGIKIGEGRKKTLSNGVD